MLREGNKIKSSLKCIKHVSICHTMTILSIVQFVFQFSYLVDHIHGEESNKFTNTLGESVVVTVQDSEDATSELLCLLSFFCFVLSCLSLCHIR